MNRVLHDPPHEFGKSVDAVIVFYHTATPALLDPYAAQMETWREEYPKARFIYVTSSFMGPKYPREYEASQVTCRIIPPIQHGYTLRVLVGGLKNATVHFPPEPGTEENLEILHDPTFPYFVGDFVEPIVEKNSSGTLVMVNEVHGEVLFSW